MPTSLEDFRKAVEDATVEAVAETKLAGMPSGHLYASLMTFGFTLETYETLIAQLVAQQRIVKRGHLLFVKAEHCGASSHGFTCTRPKGHAAADSPQHYDMHAGKRWTDKATTRAR